METVTNVTARPYAVSPNRLWPWALNLLSVFSGGPKPGVIPTDFTACDFYQEVPIGSTFYVYSPGYESGETFPAGTACRWQAVSPQGSHLELECTDFRVGGIIPGTDQCGGDRLYVTPTGDPSLVDAEVHCGQGGFMVTSVRNAMSIVFQSDFQDDPMDRFLCSLTAVRDSPPPCDCGRRNEMRIVGGIETGVNEFPMMAALIDPVIRRVFCGATIISKRYSVTAAHCIADRDSDPMGIGLLVGDHDVATGSDTTSAKLYKIVETIIHPDYVNEKQGNDIALVKVGDEGVSFEKNVGPVCLPFRYITDSFTGERVSALGWGTTSFGGEQSDVLREAFLSVISIQRCRESYMGQIGYRQICTFESGSDSCQSDSGGPVLWLDQDTGRIQLVGIISYGVSCATEVPSVNTRVTSYLDWIVLTTDEEYCVA